MATEGTIVLFDIGGVLIKLNYRRFIAACAEEAGCSYAEFRDRYVKSGIELRATRGPGSAQEFLDGFRNVIGKGGIAESRLLELVSMTWDGEVEKNIRLKEEIHEAGSTVGLFSNISEIALGILPKAHPKIFETYGGPKIMSCKIGDVKPNPPMYEAVKGYKRIIYIDDNINYLAAGAKFGWKTVQFTEYIDAEEIQRAFDPKDAGYSGIEMAKTGEELRKTVSKFGAL